jgi:hypothetical protein
MRVILYEGDDTAGVLGRYTSPAELKVGQIVAIPSGATYKVNKLSKSKTTGGGLSFEQDSIFCSREEIVHLTIQPD